MLSSSIKKRRYYIVHCLDREYYVRALFKSKSKKYNYCYMCEVSKELSTHVSSWPIYRHRNKIYIHLHLSRFQKEVPKLKAILFIYP